KGVQGLYSKQDLDLLEINAPNNEVCRRAVIVGGGLIGIELAEMLSTRKIPVTFLVREHNFWGNVLPESDAKLINNHIKEHHIDLRLDTNLKEILADKNGKARAVIVEGSGEEIPCDLVGLTAGVSPNIDFLKDSGISLLIGVKVNRYLETNVENIYAIGDCAEQQEPMRNRRTVEAVWYTGRMMGEVVAQTICRNKMPYKPGHWFNSAKFFDIEYQTYGWVFSKPRDGESHFHWHHEDGKKGVTICYETQSRKFLGINTFGIRLRHEVMDRWLTEGKLVDDVVANLHHANFDPEFYKRFEKQIQQKFTTEQKINV
ncbi:MAG: FAD/NAD(P)-binding oxidoreductase, partial [Flavobacteriaceae bacterium]